MKLTKLSSYMQYKYDEPVYMGKERKQEQKKTLRTDTLFISSEAMKLYKQSK